MITPGVLDTIFTGLTLVLTNGWLLILPSLLGLLAILSTWFLLITTTGLILKLSHPLDQGIVFGFAMVKVFLFQYAITNLHSLTDMLANSLVGTGLLLGGGSLTVAQFLSPGTVFAQGLQSTGPLVNHWNMLGTMQGLIDPGAFVFYGLGMLASMMAFALIALHLIMVVTEYKIVSLFSGILLPFGVVPQLKFLAMAPLEGLVASAIRLGVLAMVASVILPLMTVLGIPAGQEPDYWSALNMATAAWLMVLVSWKAPNYAAAMLSGRVAAAAGDVLGMAMGITFTVQRTAQRAGRAAVAIANSPVMRPRPLGGTP